jgi:Poly A polymerase head domain
MTDDAPASPGDLRVRYRRAAGPPVWTGDYLGGQCIVGFALAMDPGPADQVLVTGDEHLAAPPYRPLPAPEAPGAAIERTGPSPVDDLAAGGLLQEARTVGDGLDRQLSAMGESGDFVRTMLGYTAAEGHLAWLVGGAVRDLLSEGTRARPADLDFTGTIGPGELYDAARRWRRAAGMADYRQFISRQLVWAVAPPGGTRPDAFVEYKPLSQPGFRFPAWGGTLARDAATRDLTINAIYYDHRNRVVADPTGRAIKHLLATPRVAATPYEGDDPVEQAAVLLRCLKFRLRWPDLDVAEISAWAAGLPGDPVARVPEARWAFLTGLHGRCVPQRHRGADELAAAREIGPVAVRLLERVRTIEKAGT